MGLLDAIGRFGAMGFFSARGRGLHWTCDARILDQRTGLSVVPSKPPPSPPPPPPPSHTSSPPPSTSATGDGWRPACLYGGRHSVHCTVLCALYSPLLLPLVPLLQHGGDLQPGALIHRYTHRARPGTTHHYRLALCLKQGFGEDHRRTSPRDFLVFFLEEFIQKATAAVEFGQIL